MFKPPLKLPPEKREAMRREYQRGKTQTYLAMKYRVSQDTVSRYIRLAI